MKRRIEIDGERVQLFRCTIVWSYFGLQPFGSVLPFTFDNAMKRSIGSNKSEVFEVEREISNVCYIDVCLGLVDVRFINIKPVYVKTSLS